MERIGNFIKLGVILFFILGSSQTTYAKSKKKGQLVKAINEAVDRSENEQERIKIDMSEEADQRIETWADRERDMIEIKHSGMSSIEAVDLGPADLSYEEVGIDQSGLDNLHSEVEDEPIYIDFDKELRDVSSIKD